MAGTFQFLHSRELVWTRRMREYLLGEREERSDLSAWNADTTRMPALMHHQYLTGLYLHNALAGGRWRVDGHAVSLADIRVPVFLIGTENDHVSPWHSVYQLHRLCDAEVTFVLVAGGHNAGIISEPGHPRRHYRIALRRARGPWLHAERWQQQAELRDGSWWPAWQTWLAARSGTPVRAKPIPADAAIADAPGTFVLKRYAD
jgi:polyhydroxyalkanoate synthase